MRYTITNKEFLKLFKYFQSVGNHFQTFQNLDISDYLVLEVFATVGYRV